jgi:DNA ligase-1
MPDIANGESVQMQGSGKSPYILKNVGGVYSCSCPAWRNQSLPIERRTCKHLRKYRGEQIENERVGSAVSPTVVPTEDKPEKDAAPVLLAHVWENDIDLDGWWISEKLDGVRAYWDGKQLLSRNGNVYHAPDWFIARLPNETLDGELWLARKSFQVTSGIVRRHDKSDEWKRITYRVFDAPKQVMPFEQRQKFLYELLHDGQQFVQILPQIQCRGLEHLKDELQRVEALGGEGLMLRQPASLYEVGRSNTLLKVKSFFDAEAMVLDYEKGKGRHKGRMGALVCRDCKTGVEFKVGTGFTDAQRNNPPTIGCIITYRFQELTDGGKPRFPAFVR